MGTYFYRPEIRLYPSRTKMTAAVLVKPNEPLELREIEWAPLTYGQVLVKVLVSGICGAQLQEWRGDKGTHFPRLLGHEACVQVEKVGPAVTSLQYGDICVAHWRKGVGIESESPRFKLDGQEHSAGQITTFSTHSVISENRLTRVPAETPMELCALLGCGLSTALGTIENEANLKIGESILIIGCGGLGLNLVLAARLRGGRVAAMDSVEEKMVRAFSLGARSKHSFVLEKEKFDVVIDTSGNIPAIEVGISCLAPSGRFIMVGQPKPLGIVYLADARHLFEGEGKSICATQGGRFEPSKDVPRYVAAFRDKILNINGLITHRLPLSQINEGLEMVRQGQAGRVMIDCAA